MHAQNTILTGTVIYTAGGPVFILNTGVFVSLSLPCSFGQSGASRVPKQKAHGQYIITAFHQLTLVAHSACLLTPFLPQSQARGVESAGGVLACP